MKIHVKKKDCKNILFYLMIYIHMHMLSVSLINTYKNEARVEKWHISLTQANKHSH